MRHRPSRKSQLPIALAMAALCLAGALAVTGAANGAGTGTKVKTIGATKRNPPPDCPTTPTARCGGFGSVTGIQIAADGRKQPFRLHKDGKVVAFSIDSGDPTKDERKSLGTTFASERFGSKATARLAILKRTKGREFKLKRQSPIVILGGSAFGTRYYWTLRQPLRVVKGLYVGLTVPTWLTAIQGKFPVDGDPVDSVPPHFTKKGNQWIASRAKSQCSKPANDAHPQQKVGSKRTYGCKFQQARIFYHAYYQPK